MTDDELVDASDESLFAAFRATARMSVAGEVLDLDGVLVTASGVPLAAFNVAHVTRPGVERSAIREARSYFERRTLPYLVRMREGIAIDLDGLHQADAEPGMALDPIPTRVPTPPPLEIRALHDPDGIAAHAAVCAVAFGIPDKIARDLLVHALHQPDCEFYAGYIDGRPVASSLLVRSGETAGVHNVATIPSARRRGYGEAMTWHAVARGREAGCTAAVLQSSEMGYPIYARMGFRTITRYLSFTPG